MMNKFTKLCYINFEQCTKANNRGNCTCFDPRPILAATRQYYTCFDQLKKWRLYLPRIISHLLIGWLKVLIIVFASNREIYTVPIAMVV